MKSNARIFIKKKKRAVHALPSADKGVFPDFMRKEIFNQPELVRRFIEKYIVAGKIDFDFLKIKIEKIKRVYITGNSADYGCVLAGTYNFEVLVDIPCIPILLSEFNFSNPVLDKSTLVLIVGSGNNEQCRLALKRINENSAKVIKIFNFMPENSIGISLNINEGAEVSTAGYTLRSVALSMLALYFGEKNQIITELYVKIAAKMLESLSEKIKHILEQEYIIRQTAEKISSENLLLVGANVDFAAAVYGAYALSFAFNKDISAVPIGEISFIKGEKNNVIGFASNESFHNVLVKSVEKCIKIIPQNIDDISAVFYDDTIPLFNPVLSTVVVQLMAYTIARKNNITLDKENKDSTD